MAEQNTDDTKQPIARRGARPFTGPAGAAGAPRPFSRPAAPGQRPGPAPFAPPAIPARPTVGTAQPAKPTAEPISAPAAPIELTKAEPAGPASHATPMGHSVAPLAPDAVSQPVQETLPAKRPVTSETVAVDAFDAFDTVWDTSHRSDPMDASHAAPSLLDETSLGSGVDAQHLWAEEITRGADLAATPTPATPEPARTTPTIAMPAWLADDPAPSPAVAQHIVESAAPQDQNPAPLEKDPLFAPPDEMLQPEVTSALHAADVAADTPTAADWTEAWSSEVAQERPRFEVIDEPQTPAQPLATDPRLVHGWRVSAALDRLAERVRRGEIDVSSVAPEATDAAVLASVLAALLGGSTSR